MTTLNTQTRFVQAVSNYKVSSRGIVEIYEEMLQAYAGNLLTEDLAFAINALSEFPRLQKKAIEITKYITGAVVELPENTTVYTVSAEKLSKKVKSAIREKIEAFVTAELSSLLNWERETSSKESKPFDAIASQKRIKQSIEKQITEGLPLNMAISLLETLANEFRNKQQDSDSETAE